MKTMIRLTVIAALISIASPALAATTTGQFQVTATVVPSCRVTTNDLAFLNYEAALGNLDVGANLVVQCTRGTTYTVGIDSGQHYGQASSFAAERAMAGLTTTTDHLAYQLFRDGARLLPWGNVSGSWLAPPAATGVLTTHVINGRIPGDQFDATAQNYRDFPVTVTVTY
jgi:spore coat protein U-like protein